MSISGKRMSIRAAARRRKSALAIAELFEQLARVLVSRAIDTGINPAQWAALRYVARSTEAERTVGAFARFHLTTPSSASQTIAALVGKGLLEKAASDADGRSRVLKLTRQGNQQLDRDPLRWLVAVIGELSDDQLFQAAEILERLMKAAHGQNP
jgi:DNA-binding MarR family transcriptional regulator